MAEYIYRVKDGDTYLYGVSFTFVGTDDVALESSTGDSYSFGDKNTLEKLAGVDYNGDPVWYKVELGEQKNERRTN